jgi:hypothetical protein
VSYLPTSVAGFLLSTKVSATAVVITLLAITRDVSYLTTIVARFLFSTKVSAIIIVVVVTALVLGAVALNMTRLSTGIARHNNKFKVLLLFFFYKVYYCSECNLKMNEKKDVC